MTQKPLILLVNDDGIYADGIRTLWNALVDKVDLVIVAPAIEQSGVGMSISYRTPVKMKKIRWDKDTPAYKITGGTPADCVRMALSTILDRKPDMIVSGINHGTNAGKVILYSGTVGGVIEGIYRDIPGIAFSISNWDKPNFDAYEKHVYPIVSYFLKHSMPQGTFINVTFPEQDEIKGFRLARQGKGYFIENPDKRLHPDGYHYYWLGGKWSNHEEEDESEITYLKQGYATAAPIKVTDLTHLEHYAEHKVGFESLF